MATLKTILAGEDYAGLDDQQAAALANQPRHTVTVPLRVSYLTLAAMLDPEIVRRLIVSVDAVAESDPLVSEVRRFLRSDGGVDLGHASTLAFLDSFGANNALPLTPEDAAAIKALAVRLVSDAESNGLGQVEVKHVRWARESE